MDLRPLTDAELLARLRALAASERECVADVVEHLAELHRRNCVADTGCHSLFDYCLRVLGYSEAGAYTRIAAAKAALKDPRVIHDLRAGRVHLEAVCRLAPHLTSENSDRLLDLACGATKREVQALVVSLGGAPAPERDVIRIVAAAPAPDSDEPQVIPPVTHTRLAFTADAEFLRMLDRLRALRRHKFPRGKLEDVLKESMMVHLAKLDAATKPARPREPKRSIKIRRWIPRAVKRTVWARDEGRCAFVSPEGLRCGNKEFLEYDHIVPFALGGRSDTPDNIRLLCRPHNQRLASKRFGPRC